MNLISIIIPVHLRHNRDDILGACLESIGNQTYPKDKMELILIGDGCNLTYDLSLKGIKTVTYNFKSHVGLSKATNKAIGLSNGELLAFIDADCVAQEDWLTNLASGFKDDDIGGCGGKILYSKNRCINNRDVIYGIEYILPSIYLCNAIFQKKALEDVGLLDEGLPIYAEDVDLPWRVYLKGYRIEYMPDAVVADKTTQNVKNVSFGMIVLF